MLKINKQISRLDGSKITSGSIMTFDSKFIGAKKQVAFFCQIFISKTALESGKQSVKNQDELPMAYIKECTDEEWAKINDSGAVGLVEGWLKEEVEKVVGVGYVEII